MTNREYQRQWRLKNRDAINERKRASHALDKDANNEKKRARYAANKEQYRARQRAWDKEWRQKNPDKLLVRWKKEYARDKDKLLVKVAAYHRTDAGRASHAKASRRYADSNPLAYEVNNARSNLANKAGVRAKDISHEILEAEVLRLRITRLIKNGRETIR